MVVIKLEVQVKMLLRVQPYSSVTLASKPLKILLEKSSKVVERLRMSESLKIKTDIPEVSVMLSSLIH